MDWETSFRLLTTEMNRHSQTDLDMAQIAMVNAMEYYRSFPFDFNHGFETVHLAKDQEIFNSPNFPPGFPAMQMGMPGGMKRPIVIQIVGLVTSGDVATGLDPYTYSAIGGNPLKQISMEEMATLHQGVGNVRVTTSGYPCYFSWMGDGSVRLYPAPFQDMVASVYYVKDAHRPRYRWQPSIEPVESPWVFEQLRASETIDGGAGFWQWVELSPTFSNLWLEHAEPLIRAWARKELAMSLYSDAGMAQISAASLRDQEGRFHYESQSGMLGTNPRRASSL